MPHQLLHHRVHFSVTSHKSRKSRQNAQLAFESGRGATSECGGHVSPCPNVEPALVRSSGGASFYLRRRGYVSVRFCLLSLSPSFSVCLSVCVCVCAIVTNFINSHNNSHSGSCKVMHFGITEKPTTDCVCYIRYIYYITIYNIIIYYIIIYTINM